MVRYKSADKGLDLYLKKIKNRNFVSYDYQTKKDTSFFSFFLYMETGKIRHGQVLSFENIELTGKRRVSQYFLLLFFSIYIFNEIY